MDDGRPDWSNEPDNRPDARGPEDVHGERLHLMRMLREEVGDLRAQLTELQVQLATEVHTRRLVVEEGDGFARVVIDARDCFGGVEVRARTHPDRPTSSSLFAFDPIDGDSAQVGACLSDDGHIVGTFDLYSGRRPRVWLNRSDNGA